MNHFFRLLWTQLASLWRKPVPVLGPCLTPYICLLTDLDVLRHMNNGTYFSLLDLARVDLMNRAGVGSKLAQQGWYPVVVAETMRFRKSLKLFDRFHVETVVLGWDEKAFLLQQRFLKGHVCVAEAVVRARFLKKSGGSVTPKEILQLANWTSESPQLPEWIQNWNQNQIN